MTVLFSHAYFLQADVKEKSIMKPYPPLGILSVAAWLEKHQIDCRVLDATFSSPEQWKVEVREIQPDVLALYANLITKVQLLALIQWVKDKFSGIHVVVGGPDVTHNLEDYLRNKIDFCIIGEGEQTMLDLTKAISQGQKDFTHIPGLAFTLPDGSVFKTTTRSKFRDLDELPMPARHKIDMEAYLDTWQTHHGHRSMSISTQRGCPYTCKWCSTAVYGQSYRRRSPDHVVKEIVFLQERYGRHRIWFVDDVFTVSHKWLEAFANILKMEQLKIEFECITRADRLNERVLDVLKQAGCFRVWIGAESGSQKILDRMDRRVKSTKVRQMIVQTQKRGMEAGTFIMLGYPGESEKDIKKTLTHLKQAIPDYFTITLTYPIKGTALYDEVAASIKKPGIWTEHTDRDLDFPRSYSRDYYYHAIRWVSNAVHLQKHLERKSMLKAGQTMIKVLLSRVGMLWHRAMN